MNSVERFKRACGLVVDNLETFLYACKCSDIHVTLDNMENGIECSFKWSGNRGRRGWRINIPWENFQLAYYDVWLHTYEMLLKVLHDEIDPWSIEREGEN